MANNLPTIPPFDAGSNPSEAWRHWREDFEDYLEALKYSKESEKTKTALFRHVCGDEIKKQLRAFDIQPATGVDHVSLKQILEEFDKYFADYQNEIYATFKFLEIKQEKGEKFADYYSRLRCAVIECNYGDAQDRMLRDKIIQGLNDKPLQERLIRETSKKTKTLLEVVSECKTAEHSKAQASEMNENKLSVDAIKKIKSRNTISRNNQNSSQKKEIDCTYCGKHHAIKKCPAYGSKCRKCDGKNHWAKMCKTKVNKHRDGQRIHAIEEENQDIVYIGELKSINELERENSSSVWLQNITVNNYDVMFKLDTGSQVNVIPKNEILKWSVKPVVTKCKVPVLDYSDNVVPILGKCNLMCITKKCKLTLEFLVTSLDSCPILGLEACKKLNLIQRLNLMNKNIKVSETAEDILEEFSDVFSGSGKLKRIVKIKLKPDATPHVAAPRKVPLALHNKVKEELNRMVHEGIIAKVEEPTEWVSNMVIVNNPNKLRICLDPRPLNEAIKRPHYPIPTVDTLMTKLQGCKFFTIFDAKNGFWQLPLDDESSKLTTFTTPWGRFRFLVLPFGLNNAPEEFQRAMEEIFEDEPEINPYFDDIAVGSKSIEEHCRLLRRTLLRARQANLKFNSKKTQLCLTSVNYLGHVLSENGIKPDPKKIKAIKEFAVPKNREDLQRFLGMITYLAKFTPHLSDLTHSLRQLLKRDSVWIWDENMEQDFTKIKQVIIQAPCLQYFDKDKTVTISVDASRNGLGAVLIQDSKPVAFGSASLTESQQRYAQIEKELLAVIYGLEHFNYYTYGRPVVVQTDHKPLLGLSKKPYDLISPRLQRLLLRLNRYDVKLEYVPGKELLIADALSRAQSTEEIFDDVKYQEATIRINVLTQASQTKWEEIALLTKSDPELQDVVHHIKNGWPDKNKTRPQAKSYWHCKEELHVTQEGIVCRGQRLVVPTAARKEILEKLHISHKGIVSCKIKAREYFYWPGINSEVENYISKCKICQKYQRSNTQEILFNQDLPERPWQKVACDFFYLKGRQNLLMIDYFSKYVELKPLNSTTAQTVMTVMKSIFATHGIPEELVSDGGPPFSSFSLQKFFQEWNIVHRITSPHFSRANGQIERAVQTIKKSLRKAEEEGKDIYTVLLDHRIQPANDLPSPAELLMGRRLRSYLPSHPKQLKPKFPIKLARDSLKKRQDAQKKYANRSAIKLAELPLKAKVWFRHDNKSPWKQGIIIQKGPEPRSYLIKMEDGKVYRRNRFHIRPDTTNNEDQPIYTRTVEDLYPSFNNNNFSVSNNSADDTDLCSTTGDNNSPTSIDSESSNNVQNYSPVCVRRSGRNVIKPSRYRD